MFQIGFDVYNSLDLMQNKEVGNKKIQMLVEKLVFQNRSPVVIIFIEQQNALNSLRRM